MQQSRKAKTPANHFLLFQLAFWLISGVLLFLYGLSYGHWHIAAVRNIYVPLLGLVSSYFLVYMFARYKIRELKTGLAKVILLSGITAGLMAAVVNPITYSMLGHDLSALPLVSFLQDMLYFFLFFLLWSILYISYFTDTPKSSDTAKADFPDSITVEKNRQLYKLKTDNILLIRASGDYVELVTDEQSYLKSGNLKSWENSINPDNFQRISRSLIVNLQQVVSVKAQPRGVYTLVMRNALAVQSSRSYKDSVLARLPKI